MARRPGGAFALVFTDTPPSAEVFKKTELGGDLPDVSQRVRVSRPSWEECDGVVVATGTRKDLLALKVDKFGNLTDLTTEAVPNRFQALLAQKKQAGLTARENHLQQVAANLVASGGPGNMQVQPGRSILRLPKKRPQEDLDMLRTALENLPCFKEPPALPPDTPNFYTKLGGEEVFMKTSHILLEQTLARRNPSSLFNGLVGQLIPKEVLANPALSVSGTGHTVPFPKVILAAVNMAVRSYCAENKIPPAFNAIQVLRNFLYSMSHPNRKKRQAQTETQSANSSLESANTGQDTGLLETVGTSSTTSESTSSLGSTSGTISLESSCITISLESAGSGSLERSRGRLSRDSDYLSDSMYEDGPDLIAPCATPVSILSNSDGSGLQPKVSQSSNFSSLRSFFTPLM